MEPPQSDCSSNNQELPSLMSIGQTLQQQIPTQQNGSSLPPSAPLPSPPLAPPLATSSVAPSVPTTTVVTSHPAPPPAPKGPKIKTLYGKPVPAPSRVSKRAVEKSSKLKADEAYELELAQQEAARFAHVNKLREAAAAVKAEAKKKKKITKTTTFGGEGMTYLPASANGASTSNKVRITEQAQFCFNHTSYLMISKA